MIINGGSRSNGAFFARHLMRAEDNERITVTEMRGFAYAEDVPQAFREMQEVASGTRVKNFFYHANINTRKDEVLTPEQWAEATDKLERELHLDGQPRFIVEHEKGSRIHRHVVWSRIDTDSMTAISDSHNYRTHELVATELERDFQHQETPRALTRDKETTERPEPNVKDWESFRAAESKIDPKAIKAELTGLWQHSDSGPAFAAALEERGFILAKGDRRDFCIIDQAGDEHSLTRRIGGVKAADIRARMADVDRDALPSVEEARALARNRPEEPTGEPAEDLNIRSSQKPAAEDFTDDRTWNAPPEETPFQAIMRERIKEERQVNEPAATPARARQQQDDERPLFARVMQEAAQEAEAAQAAEAREFQSDQGGTHWERFSAWLSTMREHVAGFGQQVRDYWSEHFGSTPEPEAKADAQEQPTNTISGRNAVAEPIQPGYNGPELG